MELKSYQQRAISDLIHYLELMNVTENYQVAFHTFWQEKSVPALGEYREIMPGIPNLCFKVPTGGGKTFLACNAIKPVFEALPFTKIKAVVWLVPSEAILTQTLKALKNPHHPYRQKLDVEFRGRVEVYSKEELLNGQNFNSISVTEQLSIMVLSYDSFRGRGREVLKSYQENSKLLSFSDALGTPAKPISNADESSLFQVINQLNPLVIVDESHHARSDLSLTMLKDFNPCFVLDLTATPREAESNVIAYVDAIQLKNEHMVKLPVILYNRSNHTEVLVDTIDLRNSLENMAKQEEAATGKYIRPIALFQAQPRSAEDATTFEKLREELIKAKIPAEQIAIRTAAINELKNVVLLDRACPIRYIITVNALKEGWDCPFAYVLASLANKTSVVDVEQVLGRILRLPYTREHEQKYLNMSYVLTASNDFHTTIEQVIKGLNNAGFSKRDFRLATKESISPAKQEQLELKLSPVAPSVADDELAKVDGTKVGELLALRQSGTSVSETNKLLQAAEEEGDNYTKAVQQSHDDPATETCSWEEREQMTTFSMKKEFVEDATKLQLPQFFIKLGQNLMGENSVLLEREQLARDFFLKDKDSDIDFAAVKAQLVKIDVNKSDAGQPTVAQMDSDDQRYYKQHFQNKTSEERIRACKDLIFERLNKMNQLDSADLNKYLNRIIENMDSSQLSDLEQSPLVYAYKIKEKIESLLAVHYHVTFEKLLAIEKIVCKESYRLSKSIHPVQSTEALSGSLYEAEERGNGLEYELVLQLTSLQNILWWHRNIARKGFCINGFINHYPDVIIRTKNGKVILAETKGPQLKNDDTAYKIALGNAWEKAAGNQYRYFMVFEDNEALPAGAVSMSNFFDVIKQL